MVPTQVTILWRRIVTFLAKSSKELTTGKEKKRLMDEAMKNKWDFQARPAWAT